MSRSIRIRKLVKEFRKRQQRELDQYWEERQREYRQEQRMLQQAGSNDTDEKLFSMMSQLRNI